MAMDNPWGSPWAEEVQNPEVLPEAKHDDQGNDTRPRTPIRASNLGYEVKANSPWNDQDDGFGDWTGASVKEEEGLGYDGADDGWESRATAERTITKHTGFDGLSWDGDMPLRDDTISKSPNLLPGASPIPRPPSPDPWASETTLNIKEDLATISEAKIQSQSSGSVEIAGDLLEDILQPSQESKVELLDGLEFENNKPIVETNTHEGDQGLEASGKVLDLDIHRVELLGTSTYKKNFEADTTGFDLQESPPTRPELEANKGEPKLQESVTHDNAELESATLREKEEADADHESSRPSSSPSDHSNHDALPESPRTSLDEEPKRLQAPRKVSSRIQGLVEHFDGLARQEEERSEPSRTRSPSKSPDEKDTGLLDYKVLPDEEFKEVETEDEFGDFGEFEEGQSDIEEFNKGQPPTPVAASSRLISSPVTSIAPQVSPPRTINVKKDFGRVEFTVSSSALEEFYLQAGRNMKNTEVEKAFIMDSIPFDSFQSLEERKIWYRLSRFESMRKHNSGDGDSYIRVTWLQSQVREQTLKTTSRWMEEDRISGRVVLGGSKGSSIFGWNDTSAAIPLASAFGTGQERKHTPASSITKITAEIPREWPTGFERKRSGSSGRTPSRGGRRKSIRRESLSESHKCSPQTPVASFGWNSSPVNARQSAFSLTKESPKAERSNTKSVDSSVQLESSLQPSLSSKVSEEHVQSKPPEAMSRSSDLTSGPSIIIPASFPASPPVSNEDDDWGEMIASPVLPVAPKPLLPQGLRHKKSQSLGGAFLPQPNSFIKPPVSLYPARGHKPTMSFDDILVPKPRNSLDSKSDPFPSASVNAFSPVVSQVPASTSTHDPWASADFSFFDSPLPRNPAPKVSIQRPQPKAISLAKPPAPSPLRHGKTRQEVEQETLVASIVKSLPDFSYMLRR